MKLLNENITDGQVKVTPEEVDAVVQDMILKGEIVSSNGNIYQSNVFVQEDETARKIAEMLAVPPVTLDISESLEYVRKTSVLPFHKGKARRCIWLFAVICLSSQALPVPVKPQSCGRS